MMFLISSVFLSVAALHLYINNITKGYATLYTTLVIQSCKMMHMWGFPSSNIFACMLLFISLAAPFLFYANEDPGDGRTDRTVYGIGVSVLDSNDVLAGMSGIWEPKLTFLQTIRFIAVPLAATVWFHHHDVMIHALEYITYQRPNELENMCGCAALYLLFLGGFALVFYRRLAFIRGCVVLL